MAKRHILPTLHVITSDTRKQILLDLFAASENGCISTQLANRIITEGVHVANSAETQSVEKKKTREFVSLENLLGNSLLIEPSGHEGTLKHGSILKEVAKQVDRSKNRALSKIEYRNHISNIWNCRKSFNEAVSKRDFTEADLAVDAFLNCIDTLEADLSETIGKIEHTALNLHTENEDGEDQVDLSQYQSVFTLRKYHIMPLSEFVDAAEQNKNKDSFRIAFDRFLAEIGEYHERYYRQIKSARIFYISFLSISSKLISADVKISEYLRTSKRELMGREAFSWHASELEKCIESFENDTTRFRNRDIMESPESITSFQALQLIKNLPDQKRTYTYNFHHSGISEYQLLINEFLYEEEDVTPESIKVDAAEFNKYMQKHRELIDQITELLGKNAPYRRFVENTKSSENLYRDGFQHFWEIGLLEKFGRIWDESYILEFGAFITDNMIARVINEESFGVDLGVPGTIINDSIRIGNKEWIFPVYKSLKLERETEQ